MRHDTGILGTMPDIIEKVGVIIGRKMLVMSKKKVIIMATSQAISRKEKASFISAKRP